MPNLLAHPRAAQTLWLPRRWSSQRTNWPKAAGRGFVPAPRDAFLSPEFRQRFRFSGDSRTIYAGTCAGLRRLNGEIMIPTAKLSTCRGGRLVERLREQSRDSYGAGWLRGQELVLDSGWNVWDALIMQPNAGPSPGSPVSVTARAIHVDLPDGLDAETFDERFDAQTSRAALHLWVNTRSGRAHCSKVGVDPAVFTRRTVYEFDLAPRISVAREICVYRTTQDADRLIAIAEKIILEALGLLD